MSVMPLMMNGPERSVMDIAPLFHDFSLEMTTKDEAEVAALGRYVPPGTPVSVTFLPNEDFPARLKAAASVKAAGLTAVPHISARRLTSEAELEGFLSQLAAQGTSEHLFIVAGDPPSPQGPYADALAVIRDGGLLRHGVRHVGIAGYPEGHPDIAEDKLWQALKDKAAALESMGLSYSIMTQFGFDADPVVVWLARLRDMGITVPVRIGVAGPANVKTLLRFAARCGVEASTKVLAKYGISITRLFHTAGPDPIIRALAAKLDPAVHGDVRLHFYPFGGLEKTAKWVHDFKKTL